MGELVKIRADDSILTEDGKINVQKLNPITYDSANHNYLALGAVAGKAFSDGQKIK